MKPRQHQPRRQKSADLRDPSPAFHLRRHRWANCEATTSILATIAAHQSEPREILMPSTNRHFGRSAAVTGAGGGLGRDIALGLAAKGYVVFGTAMSAAEVQDLKDASGGR